MNMKEIIFVAHDPGGYDVVFPVVQRLQQNPVSLNFYCLGPAADLNPLYRASGSEILQTIHSLLHEKKLSGLVTGTSWGNNLELKAIAACKEAQIPTISILDYWSNYQTRFLDESGRFVYPDYYIVMDELAAKEAVQTGVPSGIIKILGHPGLDKYTACQRNQCCSDKTTKKVLFLSQPLSVLYGGELGYTERQALNDCIRALQENGNYSLYVKFHPKDDKNFQQQYQDIAVHGNLTDIIPEYDLIIGMNTMGLLYVVLMGIPAISYQPDMRQADMCITNKLGLTRLVGSYQDLKFILNTGMVGQANKNINLTENLIWFDGRSTERVAGFIREALLDEI